MSYQLPYAQQTQAFYSQELYENTENYEETENFFDNLSFSESDGYINIPILRSVPSHDIQELYVRKPMMASSQMIQNPHLYAVPTEYIQEMKPRPPSHLKIAYGGLPKKSFSSYATNRASINQTKIEEEGYNVPSKSTSVPSRISSAQFKKPTIVKAFPINCRTSRFVRQISPTNSPLNGTFPPKQTYQKQQQQQQQQQHSPRLTKSQEVNHFTEENTLKSHTSPDLIKIDEKINIKKMNSEGDARNGKFKNCDNVSGIERIVASLDENEVEKMSEEQKERIKHLSKTLIPRVPSSVRNFQEKIKKKPTDMSSSNETNDTEITQNTEINLKSSLNNILDQLENCEISLNAVKSKYSSDKVLLKDKIEDKGIFNLKEISEKMPKNFKEKIDIPDLIVDEETSKENSGTTMETKMCSDDTTAFDIHRSKSYIVRLIDRALSKELGTVSNEKLDKKQFEGLNTMRAIKSIDRTLKMERSSSGTMRKKENQDISYTSNENTTSLISDDEPNYIKQLKDLRWCHFKHIQQEIKRLEDLERFLDNCGTN